MINHKCFVILQRSDGLKALTAVKLNGYIAILASPKHKNAYYCNGVKGKIFTFIATMHSYVWLCTVAKSKKKKSPAGLKYIYIYSLSFLLKILTISQLLDLSCCR